MWQSRGMPIDPAAFDAITFDCYGTLIDWETGIATAMGGLLRRHGVSIDDEAVLLAHARHEERIEAGPFLRYRDVLMQVARAVGREHELELSDEEIAGFGSSVVDWPAFPDSAAALARLAKRYRLGVITNCDDDLFAASARRLGVVFDPVVTAEQVGSYKPDTANFEAMFERIGLPRERILHAAQSLFHDHVPATALGLTTVWVDRRRGRPGAGATPVAEAEPDAVVPDMSSLADLLLGT